ncbi:MAG: GGDEF domain-containing protein [Actinomycetota bacterium]
MPIGLVVALLAAAGAVAVGISASRVAAADAETTTDLRRVDVAEARSELAWLHYDLLLDALVAELDEPGSPPPSIERLRAERTRLVDRLVALDNADDEPARLARAATAAVVDGPPLDWPVDADTLLFLHFETTPFVNEGPSNAVEQAEATANELVMLPSLVLNDALALSLDRRAAPAPAWAAGHVRSTADIVESAPGWLGPSEAAPLENNLIGNGPGSDPALAPIATAAATEQAAVDLASVWAHDQWMIDGADQTAGPPTPTTDLVAATGRVNAVLRDGLRQQYAAERARLTATSAGIGPSARLAAAAGLGAIAVLALIPAAFALRGVGRRERHLLEAAYSDGLTGARNRRYFDEIVAARCSRTDEFHLIAMLDMDRFKMVNDTWGHDAGDALLRSLTQRLHAQLDGVAATEAVDGDVVRIGGDEFAVAIHGSANVAVDQVEQRLRAAAGWIDVGVGQPVELAFSLGTASAHGACRADDLLRAADLATYHDKQARAEARAVLPANVDSGAGSTSAQSSPRPNADLRPT